MPVLGEHDWESATSGGWAPPGDYNFKVYSWDRRESRAGNPVVNVLGENEYGQMGRCGFTFKPGNMGNLAYFARFLQALGLEKHQINAFDTDNDLHWDRVVGKQFCGRVMPDDLNPKYHKIGMFWAAGDTPPAQQPEDKPAPASNVSDDDIPF